MLSEFLGKCPLRIMDEYNCLLSNEYTFNSCRGYQVLKVGEYEIIL